MSHTVHIMACIFFAIGEKINAKPVFQTRFEFALVVVALVFLACEFNNSPAFKLTVSKVACIGKLRFIQNAAAAVPSAQVRSPASGQSLLCRGQGNKGQAQAYQPHPGKANHDFALKARPWFFRVLTSASSFSRFLVAWRNSLLYLANWTLSCNLACTKACLSKAHCVRSV